MIVFSLSGDAFQFFHNAARAFPQEMRNAAGQVASVIGRRMRKVMKDGGGVHGASRFQAQALLTNFLRGGGRGGLGGVLANPKSIVWYRDGKFNQVIGFLSGLDKYAQAFQSSERRPFTTEERHQFYRRGIRGKVEEYAGVKFNKREAELAAFRAGYNRPARPVVQPVVENAAPELPRWMHGAFVKALQRAQAKRGAA